MTALYAPARRASVRAGAALAALALGLTACSGDELSKDGSNADAGRGTDVTTHDGTGTDASQGGCADEESNAAASSGKHVEQGTTMDYSGVPPVSGKHWAQWPDIKKTLYAADERPELGQLVHSQEHGWTIVWYDDSIAGDDAAMSDLQSVAAQVDDADLNKVVIVPWTSDDGDAFPDGMHVAFTHWGDDDDGTEWRQFCAEPSADAIAAFVERHPSSESFEPDAP
jgi:uncharacterized protein DUF3105